MKIEQNNRYLTHYTGIGAKAKATGKEADALSANVVSESSGKIYQGLGRTQFASPVRVNTNVIPQLIQEAKVTSSDSSSVEVDEDIVAMHAANLKIDLAKIEAMNDLLKKYGIDGQVTMSSMQTVPQDFAIHYIEIARSSTNLVVIELENGELVFTETEKDAKSFFDDFEKDFNLNGINGKLRNGKLSTDELKRILAEYFDVDKLKAFPSEYQKTDKKS